MSDALARGLWVLGVVVVIVVIVWAMRRGWTARGRRQEDVAEPFSPPSGAEVVMCARGRYLGSVSAGEWLDRIVVHDLGVRSAAELQLCEGGIVLMREGARSFFIPRDDVVAVRADRGIAGRVYERDGVLVMTWKLGGRLVDSGFRADVGAEQSGLLGAIAATFVEERTS